MGLIFLAASIAGLSGQVPPPEPEAARSLMSALASSQLLSLVKVFELISALALLSGFFVPAALFLLAPIIFVIFWFHLSLDVSGLPVGVLLIALWALTAYRDQEVFTVFLKPRSTHKEMI